MAIITVPFQDQFAAGAALEYFLILLQKWEKVPWITENTTKINVAFRAALSFLATLGISVHFNPSSHELVIGGLSLTVIVAGLYHWFQQYAMQHAFGGLVRSGNLDAIKRSILDVLRAE